MKKILVIGEACIDIFEYGKCTRLNPEAPTPIFQSDHIETNGGMASNVYGNIRSIAGNWEIDVDFIGQANGKITKHRFVDINSNYILLRVDNDGPVEPLNIGSLDSEILYQITSADIVVVSDYNKGFLTEETLEKIANYSKLSFIDTKKPLGIWAHGFNFIKINKKEFENPAHDKEFIERNLDKIIVTLGADGAKLNQTQVYPLNPTEVKDVSGAGDSFIAGLAVEYLKSNDIIRAIQFANVCAGIAVSQKGVVSVECPDK